MPKNFVTAEGGFALVSVLVLGSTVLTCFLLAGGVLNLITLERATQHLCHQQLLSVQRKQQQLLSELLAMNPRAIQLRVRRRMAEKQYRLALKSGIPNIIAAARAQLLAVKMQQRFHRARQHKVIRTAPLILQASLRRMQQRFKDHYVVSTLLVLPRRLAVHSRGALTGSPTYHPDKDFTKAQKTLVQWERKLPQWLIRWLKIADVEQTRIRKDCAASLVERSRGWQAQLRAGKS